MYYFDIMKGLYEANVKYLIVGGLSVNLYGVPRTTQDIDIIIAMDKSNIYKTVNLLKHLGYSPQLPVDPMDLADPEIVQDWISNRNLKAFSFYHKEQGYKIIDIVLVHPLHFDTSFQNKTVKKVKDIEIYLASIDDIIKIKEFSGRNQDISDIEMLKVVKKLMEIPNE